MTNVTSKYEGPLGLPGGPVIPAGGTVLVEKWDIIKEHQVVKAWRDAGVIFAEEPEDTADNTDKDAEKAQKDLLIAELAELGIEKNRRSSLETLQEALDAAKAAAQGQESGSGEGSDDGSATDQQNGSQGE
ncbi:hypothetical protein [Roseibium alexandrii]|uniref:Uncharacterized protein n=1 Tax=Roseibium alexandrii TaxID=388408 RepID=A0A0M6ZXX4_9HYPH|nr:hypothetical protein [Roseibium alexandrii]CTQ67137.1 hypothetical protein LAX5112_01227 [Roseibium alexandrii]